MGSTPHKLNAGRRPEESEEWLSTILRSIGDAVIATDTNGRVKFMNPVAESLTGWDQSDAEGKPLSEVFTIISEETGKELDNPVSEVLRDGTTVGLANDTLLRAKNGTLVPIDDSAAPIRDATGQITGAVLIFRDVTDKKTAAKEIKEARDFFKSVIENTMDGIMICDEKGDILSVNTALEDMCSFTKEDLVGHHASMIIVDDKDTRQHIREKTAELFEKGFASYGAMYRSKEGKHIEVECNTSLIKDDKGNYIAGVSVIRNVSERKKMEEQLVQTKKLRSLGELSGGVAHDFNNVLAAILGRVQLLKKNINYSLMGERRKSAENLKRGLEIIEKAAFDGADTVRRIQEFSRTRSDERTFVPVDVNELLGDAIEFTRVRWKDQAESKGTIISILKKPSPPVPVAGIASQLREVFTNIINNAIDAMPRGGEIIINASVDGGHAVISIQDTGVGIPASIKDKIFDPFFTTKGPQSTGLGMSVSCGIVNRHRGTIQVDSVEGQGATLLVTLPLIEPVEKRQEPKQVAASNKKAAILVIEDEEAVRQLLCDVLTDCGHEIEAVPNGSGGIESFKQKHFDLVFTDLGMPGMSGWRVAEEIKKLSSKTPVALITGWHVELSAPELSKIGVDFILNKPFNTDQVSKLVEEGMQLRERRAMKGKPDLTVVT